jgi:predicted permease
MEASLKDLRYAVRTLARRPAFSAIVIVTLALGIGANAAIFSVVHAVLLRPLPYPDPGRLVRLWSAFPADGNELETTSPLDLDDWKQQNTVFENLTGVPNVRLSGFVLTGNTEPQEISSTFVSKGFFETFGMPAAMGRTLDEADHLDGANRIVVLSHGSWQRRFGADPAIVGHTITLNDEPFIVAGVMGPNFEYPTAETEIWAPLSLIPESGVPRHRFVRWLQVVARLKKGISIEQARSEMNTIAVRLAEEYPESNERLTAVTIRPLHEVIVGDVRTAMLTVFGAVGFVLLIVCANVANLVLARSEGRTREIAIRAAIGAGRGRIARQLLTESLVLALAGGAAGLAVAAWGIRALIALAPAEVPRLAGVGLDPTVIGFTAFVSLATGMLFGLAPALRIAGSDLQDSLKEGAPGAVGFGGGRNLRSLLVILEVALVVVLAIGAGLLMRSYSRLMNVDPGFNSENLLTMGIAAHTYKYPDRPEYTRFFRNVLERLESVPGVQSVGMIRPFPLRGDTFEGEGFSFTIDGQPPPQKGDEPEAVLRFTGPGYFRTMAIPLLAGRDFTEDDDRDAPLVLIINRAAAERYWSGKDPVGQSILAGRSKATIIGVVGNIRQIELGVEPSPAVYGTYTQTARVGMTFVVKTRGEPLGMIGSIQRAVWEVNRDQPIMQIATMEQVVHESVAQHRFAMALLTLFAALALVLAAVGIYGVISFTVSRQTRETGIRMALGAEPLDVLRCVVTHGMAMSIAGIGLGIVTALVATRFMASLLFQVTANDPITFVTVALLSAAVAFAAALVPALRACRTDPLVALRYE